MAPAAKHIPDGYRTITPYLMVDDGGKAIEFYTKVFGARERMRMPGPQGKIMHAELEVGDSVIMLSGAGCGDSAQQSAPFAANEPHFGPMSLCLYVPDVDATVSKATAAGAEIRMPIENKFYGDRSGTIVDPFGHIWSIMTHIEDVSPEEMQRRMQAVAPA